MTDEQVLKGKEGRTKLNGKVAIFTGNTSGIGEAIAVGFAKEGAKIVTDARTEMDSEDMPGTICKTDEQIQALGVRRYR